VSWPLASFLLLGVVIAAGFAWYERSHPTARVLALVATLAALAALGRIAFAPLPNVKPTTDIVLIAGYALGGAPGFAVGAVAALVSNLFFGQGPWTPWQMLAWGGVGIGGALLARLRGGRPPGRATLAVACAVAGLAFGTVMNVSTWVAFGGAHTLGQLAAIAGAALWFDVAHAAGNVAFALAFGPGLVRALARYRARFEVVWRAAPAHAGAGVGPLAVLAVLALGALPAPARAAAPSPAAYLLAAQNADGGFGAAPGRRSDEAMTGWAALGLAAAGHDPRSVRRAGGATALAYLERHPPGGRDAGGLERALLVLAAVDAPPPRLAGLDLVAALRERQLADGSIAGLVNLTAFGALALRGAAADGSGAALRAAARWLARQQNRDGGFGFDRRGTASEVDTTAAALQALVAAGRGRSRRVTRAVAFLRRAQADDGGFPLQPGGTSNAQSTAWAVQGVLAAGRDPERLRTDAGRTPLGYLRALIAPDGSVRYARGSAQTPVWVTAQALLALERRPFPLAPVAAPGIRPARERSSPSRAPTGPRGRPARPARASARAPAGRLSRAVAFEAPLVPDARALGALAGFVASLL